MAVDVVASLATFGDMSIVSPVQSEHVSASTLSCHVMFAAESDCEDVTFSRWDPAATPIAAQANDATSPSSCRQQH